MATKTKSSHKTTVKTITPVNPEINDGAFQFHDSFKETFQEMIKMYDESLTLLNKVVKKPSVPQHCVCNCCYNMRYIKPKDISTYISNLEKAFSSRLLMSNINDIEMFAVASVKKFIEQNKCAPFEDCSMMGSDHRYVNPKEYTLHDLIVLCENDTCGTCVYSGDELMKRAILMKDDIKIMNDMHFAAVMKNLVNGIPRVMNSACRMFGNPIATEVLITSIEEFILFTITLNTITVFSMMGYASPSVTYHVAMKSGYVQESATKSSRKKDDEKKSEKKSDHKKNETPKHDTTTSQKKESAKEHFHCNCTECMIKTNDFIIRNRVPFNMNMRDVVLLDVSKNFSDTKAALHFIKTDPRSPIAMLLIKHATNKNIDYMDQKLVTQLLVGHTKDYDPLCTPIFHKKTEHDVSPEVFSTIHNYDQTDWSWLSNIAYGNNYLDGNYRRDAMGNNKSRPILNTMDTLWKIFSGCALTKDEDIANNIIRVIDLMIAIADYYPCEPVENYDMVKDILCLLGEILTRNMLKLYHNNTQIYEYRDSMSDSMTPNMIMESFVMEGIEYGGGNESSSDEKKSVDTSNKERWFDKITAAFKNFINKIMRNFPNQFMKNHSKELEDACNDEHKARNAKIEEAIRSGKFPIKLTDEKVYFNLSIKFINESTTSDASTALDGLINTAKKIINDNSADENKELSDKEIIKAFLPKAIREDTDIDKYVEALLDARKKEGDTKAKSSNMLKNYLVYGKFESNEPEKKTFDLTAEQWKDIYENIYQMNELIQKLSKYLADISDVQTKKIDAFKKEFSDKDDKNKSKYIDMAIRLANLNTFTTNAFKVNLNNFVAKDFFSSNLRIYNDIHKNYKARFENESGTTETSTQEKQNESSEKTDASDQPSSNTVEPSAEDT